MKRLILIAALLPAAAPPVRAETPNPPARLGLCAACHGQRGHATMPGVPNLAGQHEDYLLQAMRQYRDGGRDVPVMRAALGPLGEAELKALAHWFAVQPPVGGSVH